MKSVRSFTSFVLLAVVSLTAIGCGGETPEIPAGSGGTSTASPDQIQKQMEEAMKKAGGKYKGQIPSGQPAAK